MANVNAPTTETTASQDQRAAELEALDWVRQGVEPAPGNGVIHLVSPSGFLDAWLYPTHTHRQVKR